MSYLFYLGLLGFLFIWLRPILKELNLLSIEAQRFAKDYRYLPNQSHQFKKTKELADSFVSMAQQIQELIQNQKALTNALSHELRTPLARIKFILAMINHNDEVAEDVHFINEEVAQLEDIISTMLDYAKLDYLDSPLQAEWVPAKTWIDSIFDRFKHPTVCLKLDSQFSDHHQLLLDPRLMELALSNLINNAIKYADSSVIIKLEQNGSDIVFYIVDDGQGIDMQQSDFIFQPFSRLDSSRDRKTGGFGLGLSIVKRVIQLHNGNIELVCNNKFSLNGACFKISLQNVIKTKKRIK